MRRVLVPIISIIWGPIRIKMQVKFATRQSVEEVTLKTKKNKFLNFGMSTYIRFRIFPKLWLWELSRLYFIDFLSTKPYKAFWIRIDFLSRQNWMFWMRIELIVVVAMIQIIQKEVSCMVWDFGRVLFSGVLRWSRYVMNI